MIRTLAFLGTGIAPLILLTSSVLHAGHQREFRAALAAQGMPQRAIPTLAGGTTLIEGLLGAIVLMGLMLGHTRGGYWLPAGLYSVAALYFGYSAFGFFILKSRPGAPCGCTPDNEAISGWVIFRALCLGGLALVAATRPNSISLPGSVTDVALLLLSMVGLGLVLWWLPLAMALPPRKLWDPAEQGAGQ